MLTKSERQVMELLWKSNEGLTTIQIVEKCKDKTFKDSYIHVMINSLLKKGLIKVSGVEHVSRNYARKFVPTVSKEEYFLKELFGNELSSSKMPELFSAFIDCVSDDEKAIFELEHLIKEKKKELKG
ncbi:MAG: BlaI/MecI/CopY family transcriptional regulator [Oscillospiraceae bacterium]|nr:BlaI/MecI/CopY family transcriptional regulator [Candidatus Ruminococcus equi]